MSLQEAVQDCSLRGLLAATKWASEHLIDAPPPDSTCISTAKNPYFTIEPVFWNAKAYFDMKEYDRAAYLLDQQPQLSSLSLFLKLYARFMACEKRTTEQAAAATLLSSATSAPQKSSVNQDLERILEELDAQTCMDGFLHYLYGVVLNKLNKKNDALEHLKQAVVLYPLNWSAWLEMMACSHTFSAIEKVISDIPDSFVKTMFLTHAAIEYDHTPNETTVPNLLGQLSRQFPNSIYLQAREGIYYYHQRRNFISFFSCLDRVEFEAAENCFDALHNRDPFSVEHMDIYSNILFVNNQVAKLSLLARACTHVDKYRPESCCVTGNYYSLRGYHEKAIEYFQRALKLNPSYLGTWTLMGHEYLELSNVYAALESYRRAVDANGRDFRAWYGLAQTYEMLRMPYYALRYYQTAVSIRPTDDRLWSSVADTYSSLSRPHDAIRAYLRVFGLTKSPKVAVKLGSLYASLRNDSKAEKYYKETTKDVVSRDGGGNMLDDDDEEDMVDAVVWLMRNAKEKGKLDEMKMYASWLTNRNGPEREEAKTLLLSA